MFVRLLVSAQCIVSLHIAVWLAIGVPFLHGPRTTTCSICGVTPSLRSALHRGLSCVSLDLTKGDRMPPHLANCVEGSTGYIPPVGYRVYHSETVCGGVYRALRSWNRP